MFRFIVLINDLWQLDHLMSDSTIFVSGNKNDGLEVRVKHQKVAKIPGYGLLIKPT
jgi:hypothetical protein